MMSNLGPCCICGQDDNVRNILTLPHPGPTPGKGWGCFSCGLPMDGAIAVLCDVCLELYRTNQARLVTICTGWPQTDGRTPAEAMPEETFEHDLSKHPELGGSRQGSRT